MGTRPCGSTVVQMTRELVVLGTASQAPTRDRNHNGYLLRWDDLGLLFDPGEGTQRQMLLADVRTSMISHVLITHEHGDHCLGLPGVMQRMVLEQRRDPVVLVYPKAAEPYIDRLLGVGQYDGGPDILRVAVPDEGAVLGLGEDRSLVAAPLDHRVPAIGYRLEERTTTRFVPALLERAGLSGPIVGRLRSEGRVDLDGRVVELADVSESVDGQSMAFVMDTRVCESAAELLDGVDLGVVEATFRMGDEDLAERYGHMTADQAGRLAADARVRRLVVTHFSQRYPDTEGFAVEAARHHPDVVAAVDLSRIAVPERADTVTRAPA